MASGRLPQAVIRYPPSEYEHTIQVPGLIDLAEPAFPDVAYTYADQGRENTGDPDYQYDYFW